MPVALASWRSAFAALRKMKILFLLVAILTTILAAIAILLVHEISPYLPLQSSYAVPAAFALVMASAVIQALILMPLAIAVHRFVLLGEVFSTRPVQINVQRYKRFAIYASL